jgi:hypothetical protein
MGDGNLFISPGARLAQIIQQVASRIFPECMLPLATSFTVLINAEFLFTQYTKLLGAD